MRIYLAGPLFTPAERELNTRIAQALRAGGHEVWVPQDAEIKFREDENLAEAIFRIDREGLDWAEWVVANLDGPDPDSGTCWECGYAFGRGKPVFAYRSDFRVSRDTSDAFVNLMLHSSVNWIPVPMTPTSSMQDVVQAVANFMALPVHGVAQ